MTSRNALPLLLLASSLAGCRCPAPSLGPLEDARPASLGDTGLVVDQPADGLTVDAQWVAVTGWVDRSKYAFVAVVGAPVDGFYAPTGHQGLPSVPVALREDGHFVAPRVPLAQGSTTIQVIAFTGEGSAGAEVDRTLTTNATPAPATIVVTPAEGGEAPLDVRFEPHAAVKVDNWQWDYDSDGRLDEEKPTGRHRYDTAGPRLVMARTRIDGLWVWAVAPVRVTLPGNVTHQSTQVTSPRAIVVVPRYQSLEADFEQETALATDPLAFTRYVLVADGDEVKVFDAQLNYLRSLTGLKAPQGMAGDLDGGIYVADTGNNRIVHFDGEGRLDPTFADGGVLSQGDGGVLSNPTQLFARPQLGDASDYEYVELTGLAHGVPFRCSRGLECFDGTLPVPRVDRLVESHSGFGTASVLLWFLLDGKLFAQPMGTGTPEERSRPGAVAAVRDFDESNQWWAVLYPDGKLVEHFQTVSNSRTVKLGFPATAVANDGNSAYVLAERIDWEVRTSRVSPPHVIYVAGPGRIERRELPTMTEGLW